MRADAQTDRILDKVHGELSGPACTATLDGPSTIHTGRPRCTYANTTGKLKLPGPGTLQISPISWPPGMTRHIVR